MHSQRHLFAALWLIFAAFGAPAHADGAADRAALEAAAQSWIQAFNARNSDAMAALATDDVVLMDASLPPVRGRQAARGAWQNAASAAQWPVATATKEAVIVGDIAWRIAALTSRAPRGEIVPPGQSLEIWKRVNGRWQLHRQMSSTLLAPPQILSRPPVDQPVLDRPTN